MEILALNTLEIMPSSSVTPRMLFTEESIHLSTTLQRISELARIDTCNAPCHCLMADRFAFCFCVLLAEIQWGVAHIPLSMFMCAVRQC